MFVADRSVDEFLAQTLQVTGRWRMVETERIPMAESPFHDQSLVAAEEEKRVETHFTKEKSPVRSVHISRRIILYIIFLRNSVRAYLSDSFDFNAKQEFSSSPFKQSSMPSHTKSFGMQNRLGELEA